MCNQLAGPFHLGEKMCARINCPSRFLYRQTHACIFQVIIQGLRESGVFSSVIESAPTTLSRDKFLASVDSSNSSRAVASESMLSRKTTKSRENQATARKVLGLETAAASHEAAVPPLSPPGLLVEA